jgi:hypothetical protein
MNKGVKGPGAEVQVNGIRKLINRLKGVLKPWNPRTHSAAFFSRGSK